MFNAEVAMCDIVEVVSFKLSAVMIIKRGGFVNKTDESEW